MHMKKISCVSVLLARVTLQQIGYPLSEEENHGAQLIVVAYRWPAPNPLSHGLNDTNAKSNPTIYPSVHGMMQYTGKESPSGC